MTETTINNTGKNEMEKQEDLNSFTRHKLSTAVANHFRGANEEEQAGITKFVVDAILD